MSPSTTADVLIVGAGPVGMTLAMELSLQEVSFRIVEKSPEPSDKSRALGMHSRTVEMLDRYGDGAGDLLAKATRVKGNDIWVGGRRFHALGGRQADAAATGATVDTRFPGIFSISQVHTEAFLEQRLRERGVAVERATTASHIAQDEDGVTVTLHRGVNRKGKEDDDDDETLRCRYVVGCDGAHSSVRHAMDVRFEGDAYPQEFILADTEYDWAPEYFDGTRAQLFLGDGMALMLPLGPGHARFVASRSRVVAYDDAEPTLRDFEVCLEGMLPMEEGENSSKRLRLHDASWLARFHLHHRCVTKYRDGRLFVAGDAAHIHSPIGGQGMNTGIQDSINLGWKLARALAGPPADADALLDTYHEERWPVGQHLLHKTDQMFTFLSSADPSFTFMRGVLLPHALPSMARDPDLFPEVMRYFSQLDVKYRRSRAVRTAPGFEGPVRGGFRAPDGPMRTVGGDGDTFLQGLLRGPDYHLLLFSAGVEGDEAAVEEAQNKFLGTEKNAQVHVIGTTGSSSPAALVDVSGELHKRYGFESKSGYAFVRPDGYVEDIGYLDAFVEFLEGLGVQGGRWSL